MDFAKPEFKKRAAEIQPTLLQKHFETALLSSSCSLAGELLKNITCLLTPISVSEQITNLNYITDEEQEFGQQMGLCFEVLIADYQERRPSFSPAKYLGHCLFS
jgi:hypothetical protein